MTGDKQVPASEEGTSGPERRRYSLSRFILGLGHRLAAVIGGLSILAAAALFLLTQTRPGREMAASLVERALAGPLNDNVVMGPIIAGNLLTRSVVERFELRTPTGEPFLILDTVRVEYDPLGFLRSNFTLRNATARRAQVFLVQDTAGVWNFQRVLGEPGAEPDSVLAADSSASGGARTRLMIYDLQVETGSFVVRQPWSGDPNDSEPWRVELGEDGLAERVVRIDSIKAAFPMLQLIHPDEPMEFRIRTLRGVANAVTQPLEVDGLDALLTFGDTVGIQINDVRFPNSRLSGAGWVTGSDPTQFRFDLDGEPVGFADLQWVPVPMPDTGGGPMHVELWTEGATVVLDASEADVDIDDSTVRGGLMLELASPPRFRRIQADLAPLRLRLIDRLLDRTEMIDGYITGALEGAGPITALDIDANLTFRDLEADGPSPSHLTARGAVSMTPPYPLADLRLSMNDFEPRWTRALGFDTPVIGRVHGNALVGGVPGGILAFEGDLLHQTDDGYLSRLEGSGTIDMAGASVIDVKVNVAPLALPALDHYFPETGWQGEVSGPVAAVGDLSDLDVRADLDTPRGHIAFSGRFDLAADDPTYDASIDLDGVSLEAWREGLPETALDVRGSVRGEGTDPATLRAEFDLEILPSTVAEARIDTSRIRFTFLDGLATVDTFTIRADVGIVHGRGSFGLSEDQTGALILVGGVSDLSTWNRWILSEVPDAPVEEEAGAILAELTGGLTEGEPTDGLSGAMFARGVLFGNLEAFEFGGQVDARDIRYRSNYADSLILRLDVHDPSEADSLVLNLRAWNAFALGQPADSATGRLARLGPGLADLRFYGVTDTTRELSVESGLRWGEDSYAARIRTLSFKAGEDRLELVRPSEVDYGPTGLVVRDLTIEGQRARLSVDGEIPGSGSGRLELEARGLPIGELLSLWSDAPLVDGTLDARATITGNLDAPEATGTLAVTDAIYDSVEIGQVEGEFDYTERRLSGRIEVEDDGRELGRITGTIITDLALRTDVESRLGDEAFDLQLTASDLPLALVQLIADGLEDTQGSIRGAARVQGAPGHLRWDGSLAVTGGETFVPRLAVRFVDVEGGATLSGNEATIQNLTLASSGGGTARVTGTIGLGAFTDPSFDLRLETRLFRPIDRYAMTFLLDGDGHLGGRYLAPELKGSFRLRDGDIRQDEFMRSRRVIDLTDPEILGLIDTTLVAEREILESALNPFMQNLTLDIETALGPNLWLRSESLDVELASDSLQVYVDNSADEIAITGEVLIPRGTFRFDRIPNNPQLRITSGRLDFVGSPEVNPIMDASAEYRTRTDVGPVVVMATIRGRMREQPAVTLSSDPPMSDSDQICFLALGSPCYESNSAMAQRLVQESVLSTVSSGLSSAFVGSTGLSYLNLRTVGGGQYGDSQLDQTTLFARTEIEIGWYQGENLFFQVAQPLGGGVPRATVEWRFTDDWTLEARVENRFDQQQYGLYQGTSNILNEQTYGLYVFREWSF